MFQKSGKRPGSDTQFDDLLNSISDFIAGFQARRDAIRHRRVAEDQPRKLALERTEGAPTPTQPERK